MKPFGYTLMLDCFGCMPTAADSLEIAYRYLETLVDLLGMTKMAPPIVIHAPRDRDGQELFPDKAGISGWVPLIESGIQIHALEPSRFVTIDIYSCREFDRDAVETHTRKFYGPDVIRSQFCTRGGP